MGNFTIYWMMIMCASLALLVLIITVISKLYYASKQRRTEFISSQLEDYLVDYLMGDEESKLCAYDNIEGLTVRKKNKYVLIDLLLQLSHNFSGKYSDEVFQLYNKLGLQRISLAKLMHRSRYQKLNGLYELSSLEYHEAFDEISKYIDHKDQEIRRNARVALVKVRKKEALITIKDLNGTLSQWTLINILATLKRNPTKLSEIELNELRSAHNKSIRDLSKEIASVVYVK